MTFCLLHSNETETGKHDEVDGSIDISKNERKEDAVMIVYLSYVLYFQLFLHKS